MGGWGKSLLQTLDIEKLPAAPKFLIHIFSLYSIKFISSNPTYDHAFAAHMIYLGQNRAFDGPLNGKDSVEHLITH